MQWLVNPNSELRPFGLSLWSQRKIDPKSEMVHWRSCWCLVSERVQTRLVFVLRYGHVHSAESMLRRHQETRLSKPGRPQMLHATILKGPPSSLFLSIVTLWTPKTIIVLRRIIRSWYTGHWWVGCYIWYSEERPGRAAALPNPLLAVANVTAHPSTASVPITVLLYDGPLLCGFNVAIKGLRPRLLAMSFCLSVRLFVRSYVWRLWNLLSHSLRGSTWRRAGAYRIVSDTLVTKCRLKSIYTMFRKKTATFVFLHNS